MTPLRPSRRAPSPVRCEIRVFHGFQLRRFVRDLYKARMSRLILTALLFITIARTLSAAGFTKNVAIVVYEGVEVLDLAAPAEVFVMAGRFGAQGQERAFNVYTVASKREPVASQGFLDVVPDYTVADAPKPEILVLPGGRAENAMADRELMAWMKTAADGADHVLTICYGSFIAGRLGLVDGQEITTWFGSVADLAATYPTAKVREGRRFTDNGKLLTSAGVAAGLDASLHLVARLLGRYVADRTTEYMEYAWTPPSHASSSYPQLNPRLDTRHRKLQEASIAQRGGDVDGAAAIYHALLTLDPDDNEAWLSLGQLLHGAKRYAEAIEAFNRAAAGGSQRALALYNLACAHAMSGDRGKAIDAAEAAVKAGFTMKTMLQRDPDLASLRNDPRFQKLLASP